MRALASALHRCSPSFSDAFGEFQGGLTVPKLGQEVNFTVSRPFVSGQGLKV